MAADKFHSLGGFSAGIPPVDVIDANGNVITNVLTSGNVSANRIFATSYNFANGQPLSIDAGGSNTQLQFNNSGAFGGIPNVTWNGNVLSLGDISALSIGGGINGYFLQTDGEGGLTWAEGGGGGGGNGTPGGSNTQVQYNSAGSFAGSPDFEFFDTTNTLVVGGAVQTDVVVANTANITNNVNVGEDLVANGNITAQFLFGDGSQLSNITNETANFVVSSSQPNITSVGTLTNLVVSGNVGVSGSITGGNITTNGTLTAGNISVVNNANIVGNLSATGPISFATSPNVNLGTLANIKISGGINGYVISTDGLGNLAWIAAGGNGGGVPGGSNTQVQFNDEGQFAGDPFFTFNNSTKNVAVSGNLIANSLTLGSGIYQFSRANVFFATTTTTSTTELIKLNAEDVSSVDFTVIATDNIARNRQVSKLSAVMYDANVNYNEYSTLYVNDLVGDFSVEYNPGNAVASASVALHVEPASTNTTTYKIQITVYDD